jgi:hypothetical protein
VEEFVSKYENYRNLKLVPKEFKTEELCNLALSKTFHALPFIDQDLITYELCEILVSKDGFAIQVIPDEFVTKELSFKAAKSGTLLRLIPEEYYSEELILLVFKNGRHEPDINDVPSKYITESLLVEYVKIGKGLWLDKACKATGIDKLAEKLAKLAGANDCGCDGRQDNLNKLFPRKNKKNNESK